MERKEILSTISQHVDENDALAATKNGKKMIIPNKEPTKRAALGDLQNRTAGRPNNTSKEAASKDLTHGKLQNIKPRVDSHWRKPIGTTGTAATTKPNNGTTATAAGAISEIPQRRVLTRSNSVRTASNTDAAALQRKGSNVVAEKPKTLAAKVVENKVPKAKATYTATAAAAVAVNKNVISLDEKPIVSGESALPEEDCGLSQKTLTKLKQTLNAKGVVLIKKERTSSVESTDSSSSNNVIVKKEESLSPGANVKDIDEDDKEHLILVSEYVNDIYEYLYQLEDQYPVRPGHMENQAEINGKMRAVLIDWINEVHSQFRLIAETFQLAVAIIDRYLQTVTNTKRSELQLVGVTALFLASKYEELFSPAIDDFVYITDDTYDSRQIRQMELKIFETLDCNLSRPLPIHFLRRFSKAADAEDCHHGLAKYFLELSMIESDMAHYKPSQIAAASLFLTLNLLNGNYKVPSGLNDKYWTPTLEWYTTYKANDLKAIARRIATTARNARTAKLKAVYTKYQSSKFQKISTRPELYGPLMDSIVGNKKGAA